MTTRSFSVVDVGGLSWPSSARCALRLGDAVQGVQQRVGVGEGAQIHLGPDPSEEDRDEEVSDRGGGPLDVVTLRNLQSTGSGFMRGQLIDATRLEVNTSGAGMNSSSGVPHGKP